MLELSERASEEIKKQFLKGREGSQSIRIIMTDGGWKGPYLAMAFDEPRENDHVFTERGVTFLVEKTLLERVKPIRVDYVEGILGSGFTLKSELMKGEGLEITGKDICTICS
ncbi:MAG TPA: IscA/HesB family protein [Syntrophorhabdales bacterium]|nr:IscA/HesB family protein [Syntrophorhabdales bacterium]